MTHEWCAGQTVNKPHIIDAASWSCSNAQSPSLVPAIPPTDVLRRLAALERAPTRRPEAAVARAVRQGAAGVQPDLPAKPARLPDPGARLWRPEARDGRRLEALGEKLDGGNITLRRIRADDRPIAGTRLVREYQGVEHVVTVLADGFEYEGRPYRSLSAIARAITGTRWNGWTFFGLRGRGQA